MPRSSTKKSSAAKAGTKRRLDFEDAHADNPRSKKTAVTASPRNDNKSTATPNLEAFMSPVSSKRSEKRPVVTPEEEKKQDDDLEVSFVPKYIHKNLDYQRRGKSELDPTKSAAFEQIIESHVIPDNFEQSRAHGPLSGSSFEERVLTAYSLGTLKVKDEYDGETRICTACAEKGHKRNECPTLI